jgi:hypothetical protein
VITCTALAIGGYPAYKLYITRQVNPAKLIKKHVFLKKIHAFLWNRCYFNSFNYAIAGFFRKLSNTVYKYIERKGINALNYSLARFVTSFARRLRKTHTGVLSYNMLTFVFGIIILVVLLLLFGG